MVITLSTGLSQNVLSPEQDVFAVHPWFGSFTVKPRARSFATLRMTSAQGFFSSLLSLFWGNGSLLLHPVVALIEGVSPTSFSH
jgi:hypothetical protein